MNKQFPNDKYLAKVVSTSTDPMGLTLVKWNMFAEGKKENRRLIWSLLPRSVGIDYATADDLLKFKI